VQADIEKLSAITTVIAELTTVVNLLDRIIMVLGVPRSLVRQVKTKERRAMSHAIMVPITAQGTILDTNISQVMQDLNAPPLDFSDVFLYSHGWWTSAEDAMVDYTRFSAGLIRTVHALAAAGAGAAGGGGGAAGPLGAPPASALQIGLHWPSMISEDRDSLLNILQPLSFYNRAKMADDVGEHGGYALIRLTLEARRKGGLNPPRLNLIGHSFGCKVVCSALQELAVTCKPTGLLNQVLVQAVLLQGAFDFDSFDAGKSYADVPTIPQLRILVTKSDLDLAVGQAYPASQRFKLFSKPIPGIGAVGPSPAAMQALNGTSLAVPAGFALGPAAPPSLKNNKLLVADLTAVHQAHGALGPPSGNHSDIYLDEVYQLIAGFLF
jgi:hypothetical protein